MVNLWFIKNKTQKTTFWLIPQKKKNDKLFYDFKKMREVFVNVYMF